MSTVLRKPLVLSVAGVAVAAVTSFGVMAASGQGTATTACSGGVPGAASTSGAGSAAAAPTAADPDDTSSTSDNECGDGADERTENPQGAAQTEGGQNSEQTGGERAEPGSKQEQTDHESTEDQQPDAPDVGSSGSSDGD
jgi:hypothetical protein